MVQVLMLCAMYLYLGFSSRLEARPSEQAPPEIHFSDVWCCGDHEDRIGYFDITYFNSMAPVGSIVTLHYGFERDDYSVGQSHKPTTWYEPTSVQLTRWGEFDWFIRITHELERYQATYHLVALDFWLEIKTPSGKVMVHRGSTTANGYMRASLPNMSTCADVGGDSSRRVCMAPVVAVTVP